MAIQMEGFSGWGKKSHSTTICTSEFLVDSLELTFSSCSVKMNQELCTIPVA